MQRYTKLLTLFVLALLLQGCETLGFYTQIIRGHVAIMASQRAIKDVIADDTREHDREADRLRQLLTMREFAATELALPVGDNYLNYVDLGRPYVIWNVFAAPAYDTQPVTWCFLIAGCISYRGYFAEADAQRKAEAMQAQGYDVFVGGVSAYSTLGWFDDIVLNTFLRRDEAGLAALLFHELAHQVLYIKDDTTFNESFARTVEIEGVKRWFAAQQREHEFTAYQQQQQRYADLVAMLRSQRERLQALYDSDISDEQKAAGKQAIFDDIQRRYGDLRESWGAYSRYDQWISQSMNNAKLATIASYNDWVPAFRRMLDEEGSLVRFYARCKDLAKLPKTERDGQLAGLLADQSATAARQAFY